MAQRGWSGPAKRGREEHLARAQGGGQASEQTLQQQAVQHVAEQSAAARRQQQGDQARQKRGRTRRARRTPDKEGAIILGSLPSAPRCTIFQGKQHGNNLLAECRWEAGDGAAAGAFLDRWVGPQEREACGGPIILTLVKLGAGWAPWTLAMESSLLPGQMGLFAARKLGPHDVVAWMRDGIRVGSANDEAGMAALLQKAGGMEKKYMYMIDGGGEGFVLMDGEGAREGGAKRANDARGLRRGNNAVFHEDGALRVGMWSTGVVERRADMNMRERKDAEVTWSYGMAYWSGRHE